MDLETLNSININNAAQVKELQQFLKARGYYNGPIDGKWGGMTTEGAVKLRGDLTAESDRNVEISRNTVIANDPTRNAIRGATEIGPYIGGAGVGALAGHFGARALDRQGARQAAETTRIAANPKISGQAGLNQLGQMRNARRLSVGSQFLAPAALLGSAEYIRSHIAPMKDEEGKPYFDQETQKWINLGANADQGAGLGLAAHQLYDLKNRFGTPASNADEAMIQTRAMPAPPPTAALPPAARPAPAPSPAPGIAPPPEAPALPPPSDTAPPPASSEPQAPIRNSERLRNAAAAAKGGKVRADLKKEAHYNMMKKALTPENLPDVAEALNMPRDAPRASVLQRARELKGMGGKSGLFLPFAAGALAYGLAGSNRARAEDGSEIGPSTGDRLTAAGVAAGTAYGTGKVLNALGTAGSAAGGMMTPISSMSIDPLEGAGPEETGQKIAQGRADMAYNMPWVAENVLGIPRAEGAGYPITQDPSNMPVPSPMRPAPGNENFPLSSGQMPLQPGAAPSPTAADPDVGRAWAKSPRATAIELTRGSGLDPEDIAHLAGITPDEVHSVLQGIPQGALAR